MENNAYKVTKSSSFYPQEDDTKSLKSVDEQSNGPSGNDWGKVVAQSVDVLAEFTAALNANQEESKEFSSLLYLSKRLNAKNQSLEFQKSSISDILKSVKDAEAFVKTTEKARVDNLKKRQEMTVDEWISFINARTQSTHDDDFLAINEAHSEVVEVFNDLHLRLTRRPLLVDQNENIHLCIDLENEEDRELMTVLTKVKLPEIYTLKIENFYESDEDLESFISESLTSVSNFVFLAESYCVDIHDYLDGLLKIPSVRHLYLKGFMVDSDDAERLFGGVNSEKLTFESCNIAIDEEFSISSESESQDSNSNLPVLKTVSLIDSEMDTESVERLRSAIQDSRLSASFKNLYVIGWTSA